MFTRVYRRLRHQGKILWHPKDFRALRLGWLSHWQRQPRQGITSRYIYKDARLELSNNNHVFDDLFSPVNSNPYLEYFSDDSTQT